jgi:hypothetical protein
VTLSAVRAGNDDDDEFCVERVYILEQILCNMIN